MTRKKVQVNATGLWKGNDVLVVLQDVELHENCVVSTVHGFIETTIKGSFSVVKGRKKMRTEFPWLWLVSVVPKRDFDILITDMFGKRFEGFTRVSESAIEK
jgi:hypothetical protein